jgi:lipopolysaccharide/colanic/teichoic acid biosynthesis glycosyltransferase
MKTTIKRVGDIIFAFMLLTLGSPLFFLIAILIRATSSGPIFYIQERVGRRNSRFCCLKFRTMQKNSSLEETLRRNPRFREEFEKDRKLKGDPRITPLGKFLRQTSLDELPQCWNILRGDMSVVGPRPIVKSEVPLYRGNMLEVLSVKPGLTGLWQVSGRNNLPYERRVILDLVYVREWSLRKDLLILLKTVQVILFPWKHGAY